MKRFGKSLLAIVVALMVVLPVVNVFADTKYYVYTKGQAVNFLTYDGDKDGVYTIILKDNGATSKYVRTLMVGKTYQNITESTAKSVYQLNLNDLTTAMNRPVAEGGLNGLRGYAERDANDGIKDLSLITLEEAVDLLEAKEDGEKYTVDITKYAELFEGTLIHAAKDLVTNGAETRIDGFYTSTVDLASQKVWAVKFAWTADAAGTNKISAITIEKVEQTSENDIYVNMPVVNMDKTKDCKTRDILVEQACYECDKDYKWLEVGTQAATCTVVENVTEQGKCVKPVDTGVEDYIVPVIAVLGVCALSLLVVKRKDLFRSI